MNYRSEASDLDNELLGVIDAWRREQTELSDERFNDLALRVFAHQLHYNQPYARYCARLGVTPDVMPSSWHDIPAVPSAAYKESALATFDTAGAALTFATSGTTLGSSGRHYMETPQLYDAALQAGFDAFMLPDHLKLQYLNVVPNPARHKESSLGYMMGRVSAKRGDGATGWYLDGETLSVDAFISDVDAAVERDRPVCIAITAFALVHLLDALHERRRYFALPTGSRLMETGGFKGRSRVVDRDDLYSRTAERFGMSRASIVAEYGMTELTSQYYDDVLARMRVDSESVGIRYKVAPTWLRARVVGADGQSLPDGTVGGLVHVDLANRSSCVAIQTEDLGVKFPEGLVLIGREQGATLRGCSLAAEDLVIQ